MAKEFKIRSDLLVVLLSAALVLGVYAVRANQEASQPLLAGQGIHLNEVMFSPDTGDYEWVELTTEGPSAVDMDGYGLTDEDDNWYMFPVNLPPVPPGAFVVIVFDGAGSGNDDIDFSDNVATLHTQLGLVDIFEDDTDQVALYSTVQSYEVYLPVILYDLGTSPPGGGQSNTNSAAGLNLVESILTFVAWGDAPGDDAANAAAAGIWDPSWVVVTNRSTGFAGGSSLPGEPIGLLPGSPTQHLDSWALFQLQEATQGQPNLIPTISLSNVVPGMVMESSTFAIAWQGVEGATGYHFQLDDVIDFTSPYIDTTLTQPAFSSSVIIPDDQYFWRVKVLYPNDESAWSAGLSVESRTFPEPLPLAWMDTRDQFVPGAAYSKILPIGWQLQHKDTQMLYLDGMPELGQARWDSAHEDDGDWIVGNGTPVRVHRLDHNYCVRASLAMLASYYGGALSQDRISFEIYGTGPPEGDLGYPVPNPTGVQLVTAANWALNGPSIQGFSNPSYAQIKAWIDADRPIVANVTLPGGVPHVRLIGGYAEFDEPGGTVDYWLYILDPYDKNGPKFITLASDTTFYVWVGPAGTNGAPNVMSDED